MKIKIKAVGFIFGLAKVNLSWAGNGEVSNIMPCLYAADALAQAVAGLSSVIALALNDSQVIVYVHWGNISTSRVV